MMSSVFRQICAACCSATATLTSGSEPEVKVVKLLVLLSSRVSGSQDDDATSDMPRLAYP